MRKVFSLIVLVLVYHAFEVKAQPCQPIDFERLTTLVPDVENMQIRLLGYQSTLECEVKSISYQFENTCSQKIYSDYHYAFYNEQQLIEFSIRESYINCENNSSQVVVI